MRRPQIAILADGRRLHVQDGPIDLVIEAWGAQPEITAAFAAAVQCMTGLLDALCDELSLLRTPIRVNTRDPDGPVAQRMMRATRPFAPDMFITPMAAVAGAVADHVLAAMRGAAALDKAYVNNGGDIAVHLVGDASLKVGLVADPARLDLFGTTLLRGSEIARGVATSGRHGRSFSFGIADAVTVLAADAAAADAAATAIANAVDLPAHPAVTRTPACDLQPDSDLGARLVTRAVGALTLPDIARALRSGQRLADDIVARRLATTAALHLQGSSVVSGARSIDATPSLEVAAYA